MVRVRPHRRRGTKGVVGHIRKYATKAVPLPNIGMWVRLVYEPANKTPAGNFFWIVEQAPMFRDGTADTDNWGVFGGSVGMPTSDFRTKQQALWFVSKLKKMDGTESEDYIWDLLKNR